MQSDWLTSGQQRIVAWLTIYIPSVVLGALASILIFLFMPTSTPVSLLQSGLLGGFIGGSLSWRIGIGTITIKSHPSLSKWMTLMSCMLLGVLVAASFGLDLGPDYSLRDWLRDAIILGLESGLSTWIFLVLLFRRPKQQVSASSMHFSLLRYKSAWFTMIAPQGIWLAALVLGTGMGLSEGLIFGLSTWLGEDQLFGLNESLSSALQSSLRTVWILLIGGFLVMWAMSGGLTILRHYVIRWLLARSQCFPWQAQALLDDATARVLMQRVGGGYRFMHRRLLDYFADLDGVVAPTLMEVDVSTSEQEG